MELFDVYSRYNIALEKGEGVYVYDNKKKQYLDLYGGHGVISIGHAHPAFKKALIDQINTLPYYSNAVEMPIQNKLAHTLAEISGYPEYSLFLCNSGAEANENALKLASFHNKRKKVIAFRNSFHGRTSAVLNVTDNPGLSATLNKGNFEVEFLPLNEEGIFQEVISNGDVCAVIIEGIQGVGGLDQPNTSFLQGIAQSCEKHDTLLILDEIQSGCGRSGKFFAHQHHGIQADLITMAKGIGNGFPVGGLLIHPKIKAKKGLLGTTFGGNPMACAAFLSVLETLEKEQLIENAVSQEAFLKEALQSHPKIVSVKGKGLMIGVELPFEIKEIRNQLLFEDGIFTGASSNPNVLRILPPLNIQKEQLSVFVNALKSHLS